MTHHDVKPLETSVSLATGTYSHGFVASSWACHACSFVESVERDTHACVKSSGLSSRHSSLWRGRGSARSHGCNRGGGGWGSRRLRGCGSFRTDRRQDDAVDTEEGEHRGEEHTVLPRTAMVVITLCVMCTCALLARDFIACEPAQDVGI